MLPAALFSPALSTLFAVVLITWFATHNGFISSDYFALINPLFIFLAGFLGLGYNLSLRWHYRQRWHGGTNLLSLGLISWGVGELLWSYYSRVLAFSLPYPSAADVWYSLFYPLAIAGLLTILFKVQDKYHPSLGHIITTAPAVIGILYFLLIAFSLPQWTGLKTFFDISYIVWDALLLITTIALAGNILISSRRQRYPLISVSLVGASFALMLVADILFTYSTEIGSYTEAGFIDLFYLISAFLLARAILRFHSASIMPEGRAQH